MLLMYSLMPSPVRTKTRSARPDGFVGPQPSPSEQPSSSWKLLRVATSICSQSNRVYCLDSGELRPFRAQASSALTSRNGDDRIN